MSKEEIKKTGPDGHMFDICFSAMMGASYYFGEAAKQIKGITDADQEAIKKTLWNIKTAANRLSNIVLKYED